MAVPHGEHDQKTNAESTNKKTGTKNAESTDENAEAPNWHLLLLDRLDGRCCFALAFHEDHSNVFLRRFTLPFPGRRQSLRHGTFARCLRREFAEKETMQLTYSALLCVWHLCILHRVAHRSLMKIQKRKKQNTKTLMQNVPCTC